MKQEKSCHPGGSFCFHWWYTFAMKREIEVKASVKDFKNLKEQLTKLGCTFSEPVTQHDEIFLKKPKAFGDHKLGDPVLRIRQAKGKVIFTLKKSQKVELDKIEKEVIVDNADVLRELIDHIDFHKVIEVRKIREKTNYKDMEICLDQIEGLGNFIELEKMSDKDGEEVQKELFKFLSTLGIDKKDQVTNGYDVLLYKKNMG
jgi:adenylate cyclase, class 2